MKLAHKVEVSGRELEVEVYQRSKADWVATGDLMGQRLEVTDRSQAAALRRWKYAARYRTG